MNDFDDRDWVVIKEPYQITIVNLAEEYEEAVREWNALPQPRYKQEESMDRAVDLNSTLLEKPEEETQLAMFALYVAISDNPEEGWYLTRAMDYYFRHMKRNLPEFCREIIFRDLKHTSKADLSNSGKDYVALIKENENTHVADILGLILEELQEKAELSGGVGEGLSDKTIEELIDELKEPIVQWRNFKLPKTEDDSAYEVIRRIAEVCFRHKAYRTCLLLSPLHMICGKRSFTHFEESLFFTGKVLYELGYEEFARNCFQRVDENTAHTCWRKENEKYRALLEKETVLDVPQWVYDRDADIQEKAARGEALIVTDSEMDEIDENHEKEVKKQSRKYEKQLSESLAKFVEEWKQVEALAGLGGDANAETGIGLKGQTDAESRADVELHKKVEELLALLGEAGKDTKEAVECHCLNGEVYLREGNAAKAEEEYRAAYAIDAGRYSSRLMKDFAELAEYRGQKGMAKAYCFRAEILRETVDMEIMRQEFGVEAANMIGAAYGQNGQAGSMFSAEISAPRYQVLEGAPAIELHSKEYDDLVNEIWELLVPPFAHCETVQGEVVRICCRVRRWLIERGGEKWIGDYKDMLELIPELLSQGNALDAKKYAEACKLAKKITYKSDPDLPLRLCQICVEWVLLNPQPIGLGRVSYQI
ncbi:MAG: hypothetical protein IJ716_13575 [Lachnospiraceae bacterium]|nr:hypothetical protein [Lachnospiraceae bacterium]